MKIKGAVFDLDGTLLETETHQWRGWKEVLKPFGVEFPKKEYHNYAGRSGKLIEAELIKAHKLDVKAGSLFAEKDKLLEKWFSEEPLEELHHAKEALEFFKSKGIILALASSGSRREIEVKLEKTGMRKFFKAIVSRGDVVHTKPDPAIYLLAVKKIGLEPKECIAFEDTEAGVRAAKAAGLACFAIPNEFTGGHDFSKADKVFSNLEEAIALVKEKYAL